MAINHQECLTSHTSSLNGLVKKKTKSGFRGRRERDRVGGREEEEERRGDKEEKRRGRKGGRRLRS